MIALGNILIIGDSYSAFSGYVPDGYHVWYKEERTNGLESAKDTWWGQLLAESNSTLILNESFSGTTVCNTERPAIPHTSFCYRLERLIEQGFFQKNTIDTVFVFGGTNDSWIGSPLGEIVLDGFTEERKKEVFPAFAYLIKTLQTHVNAKIVPILNCDINPLIPDAFAKISKMLGVKPLQLSNISKIDGHPDKVGMAQIKDQIIEFLSN